MKKIKIEAEVTIEAILFWVVSFTLLTILLFYVSERKAEYMQNKLIEEALVEQQTDLVIIKKSMQKLYLLGFSYGYKTAIDLSGNQLTVIDSIMIEQEDQWINLRKLSENRISPLDSLYMGH